MHPRKPHELVRGREATLQQVLERVSIYMRVAQTQKKQESHSCSIDWCCFHHSSIWIAFPFTKWLNNGKSGSRRIEGSRLVCQRLTLVRTPSHSCASCVTIWFRLSYQAWCRWTLVRASGKQVQKSQEWRLNLEVFSDGQWSNSEVRTYVINIWELLNGRFVSLEKYHVA